MPASTPPQRKRAAHLAPRPSDGSDVQVLVFSKLLTPAQVEPICTLREAAVDKVFQGVTTVSEMVRETGI